MQKCLVLNMAGTVWAAKQVILDKVYKVGAYNYYWSSWLVSLIMH